MDFLGSRLAVAILSHIWANEALFIGKILRGSKFCNSLIIKVKYVDLMC